MTESFSLTIVKIEGLGDLSHSECQLVINEKQVQVQSLKAVPVSYTIPINSIISLTINDSASSIQIASISFNSSLLPGDLYYWLPLFLSNENYIDSLPINIPSPRALLAVNKDKILNTTLESDHLPSPAPAHSGMQLLPNDLFLHYQEIIRNLQLELKQVKEICRQKCENFKEKIRNFRENLEFEKKYRVDLMSKLEKTLKINQKLNLSIETCASTCITPEVFTFEDRPITTMFDDTGKLDSEIDVRVKEIMSRLKFEGLLRKCKEINYKIGAKTITICIKNNEICVKSGQSLEKYLFSSCKTEIESYLQCKMNPRKKSSRSPVSSSRHLYLNTQRFGKF